MDKKKLVAGGMTLLGTAGVASASLPANSANVYDEFNGPSQGWTVVDVNGTVRVKSGAVFDPVLLNVGVGGELDNGTLNSDSAALLGELNGDLYLDGGTISPGSIVSTANTRIYAGTPVTTGSVASDGEFHANANVTVTTFQSGGNTLIAGGATVTANSFSFGGSPASVLGGSGTLSAGSITFDDQGQISPGIDGIGTLSIESTSPVDFGGVLINVEFANPAPAWDQILVDGSVIGGGVVWPAGFDQFTPAELDAHGPFVFLTADAISGTFTALDPSLLEIYNQDFTELLGNMELVQTATTVYFDYVPVPEPTTLASLTLAAALLGRRRRA